MSHGRDHRTKSPGETVKVNGHGDAAMHFQFRVVDAKGLEPPPVQLPKFGVTPGITLVAVSRACEDEGRINWHCDLIGHEANVTAHRRLHELRVARFALSVVAWLPVWE